MGNSRSLILQWTYIQNAPFFKVPNPCCAQSSWLIARKFMYSCNYQLNKFAYNYLNHNCNFGVDKGSFRTVSTLFIGPNSNNKGPISKALIAFTINCSFGINDSWLGCNGKYIVRTICNTVIQVIFNEIDVVFLSIKPKFDL